MLLWLLGCLATPEAPSVTPACPPEGEPGVEVMVTDEHGNTNIGSAVTWLVAKGEAAPATCAYRPAETNCLYWVIPAHLGDGVTVTSSADGFVPNSMDITAADPDGPTRVWIELAAEGDTG